MTHEQQVAELEHIIGALVTQLGGCQRALADATDQVTILQADIASLRREAGLRATDPVRPKISSNERPADAPV